MSPGFSSITITGKYAAGLLMKSRQELHCSRNDPFASPCDFFLFGNLKPKLRGEQFNIMEVLQRGVGEPLGHVTSDTMQRVYEPWIERSNLAISTDVDCV
jgi:hypothetical protein